MIKSYLFKNGKNIELEKYEIMWDNKKLFLIFSIIKGSKVNKNLLLNIDKNIDKKNANKINHNIKTLIHCIQGVWDILKVRFELSGNKIPKIIIKNTL